jgi:hypothetical protein
MWTTTAKYNTEKKAGNGERTSKTGLLGCSPDRTQLSVVPNVFRNGQGEASGAIWKVARFPT